MYLFTTGETPSLEQKIGRFKFPVLKGYQLQMVADVKRRRSSFIMYVKESLSVNSSVLK